ncbi:sulfatase [Dyadobacter tibetensis]|uniref:sulfatase n=1 Tax=Dyadobacter tibetensis TaxID=1211851 RepID=UPI0004711BC5|nr:sulfatase [Dyadobacter tibetensis]
MNPKFLKKSYSTLAIFLIACSTWAQPVTKPLQIILIVADDLGWKDLGFMGSQYYKTPNLDKLASQSTFFTQAYANSSNCAPSRASLLTGSLTPRHGIYTVGSSERGRSETRKLIPTPNRDDLDTATVTFGEIFQKNGFKTAAFGKWHLGEHPSLHGFDEHKGGGPAGHPKTYFSPYNLKYLANGPQGEELTDRLTTEALDYIQQNKENPFLLYLPYFAIHTPLEGKSDLMEKYRHKKPSDGQGEHPAYAALIENMDQNIGRIMAQIEKLGLENVLLLFTSDNGGIAKLSRQWPLRAGKGSYYEGGTRVPLLIYDSQHRAKGNTAVEVPVQLVDLLPTMVERANLELPGQAPFDGRSLLPLLRGEIAPSWAARSLFWHFPIYLEAYQKGGDDSQDSLFRTRPGSSLRAGQWKIIQYFEDNQLELYDLLNDPGERINLANIQVEETKRMLMMLQQKQKELNAPIPHQLNPQYKSTNQVE